MLNRNCNNCKYAVFIDFGYSNFTVEGTEFNCAKKLHPDAPFDRWYGREARLEFGVTCGGHEEGDPLEIDVDRENLDYLTDEEMIIFRATQE